MREYRIETELVTIPGAVEANANSITFINKGAPGDIIQIDGFPLNYQDTLLDDGNQDEKNKSRYLVTANVTTFRLYIRRKIYK
jgi:hypothetical protein